MGGNGSWFIAATDASAAPRCSTDASSVKVCIEFWPVLFVRMVKAALSESSASPRSHPSPMQLREIGLPRAHPNGLTGTPAASHSVSSRRRSPMHAQSPPGSLLSSRTPAGSGTVKQDASHVSRGRPGTQKLSLPIASLPSRPINHPNE